MLYCIEPLLLLRLGFLLVYFISSYRYKHQYLFLVGHSIFCNENVTVRDAARQRVIDEFI